MKSLRDNLSQSSVQDQGDALAASVRQGLRAGEFGVVYQPILRAGSGIVEGAECLLRWYHPEYGILTPDAFGRALSDPQSAGDAFYFMLASACEDAAACGDQERGSALRIAIDIQPSVLLDDALAKNIDAISGRYGIDPGRFDFEVAGTDDASKLLSMYVFTRPLRKLGIRLVCDNFGIGSPSIAVLGALHVDGLKLSRAFVKDVPQSARACAVMKAVFDLCAALSLTATVDGVEGPSQFEWLIASDDVSVQGSYVGRPRLDLAKIDSDESEPEATDPRARLRFVV